MEAGMEIDGAQGMYTTSPEVRPRPMRCRGGLAGAPTCDSDGDRPLVFDREAASLQMAPNVGPIEGQGRSGGHVPKVDSRQSDRPRPRCGQSRPMLQMTPEAKRDEGALRSFCANGTK